MIVKLLHIEGDYYGAALLSLATLTPSEAVRIGLGSFVSDPSDLDGVCRARVSFESGFYTDRGEFRQHVPAEIRAHLTGGR